MEVTDITFFPRHAKITVRFQHQLYTAQLPHLIDALFTMLPTLKGHICHNRNGLPFAEEAHDTELGHAFEHVMLAILAMRGVYTRGQTTWNWHRDPLGTYRITISTSKRTTVKESLLIAQAIFTNAIHGPLLKFVIPKEAEGHQSSLFVTRDGQPQLLFGASDGEVP